MKNYNATIHDIKTTEVIFSANVIASNAGEARKKVRDHLSDVGKHHLLSEDIFTMGIRVGVFQPTQRLIDGSYRLFLCVFITSR